MMSASSCSDTRCTAGVTACEGCHGWGVVNPRGKPYRWAHKGPLPEWAIPHDACNGTGMRACGCQPLDAAAIASLAGQPAAA